MILFRYLFALVSISITGAFFILSLPPYQYSFLLFFFLIFYQISYLKYPLPTVHLTFILPLAYFFYFKVYQYGYAFTALYVVCAVAFLVIFHRWTKHQIRNNFRYFLWIGSALWVFADILRENFYGNLYSFCSLLSDYTFFIKVIAVTGPYFVTLLVIFTQRFISYSIFNKSKYIKPLRLLLVGLFFYCFVYSLFSDFSVRKTVNSFILTFKLDTSVKRQEYSGLIRNFEGFLKNTSKDIKPCDFLILPDLPLAITEKNEERFKADWGNLAKKDSIYIVFGSYDAFFSYQNALCFNPLGKLLEMGEQRTFGLFRRKGINKGDYTFSADVLAGKIGLLCNEEILFQYPARSLSRIGNEVIFNPGSVSRDIGFDYWTKALVITALVNKQGLVSNIINFGHVVVSPNGVVITAKKLEKKTLFSAIRVPLGKSFSTYQKWGNIFGYIAVFFIIIPLVRYYSEKRKERERGK